MYFPVKIRDILARLERKRLLKKDAKVWFRKTLGLKGTLEIIVNRLLIRVSRTWNAKIICAKERKKLRVVQLGNVTWGSTVLMMELVRQLLKRELLV